MRSIFLVFMGLIISLTVTAQALPFVAADYNPVTLGKGAASAVETSSVAYAAFRNAAAVPFSKQKMDVAVGYSAWAPSGVSTNVISAAGSYNMNDKLGITAGFMYGMNPAYDIIDAAGASKGKFSPSDMQLNAGVSYRFIPCLSAGINLGYASSNLAEDASYGSFVADVFLMAEFGNFKAAAGVSDIGTGITSVSGSKYMIPTACVLGFGYEAEIAENNSLTVQADVDYYFEGGPAASFGAEYDFMDMVFARAGYRYGGNSILPSFASVGVGAKFAGIKIDAAYLFANEVIGNTTAVSLGYCF